MRVFCPLSQVRVHVHAGTSTTFHYYTRFLNEKQDLQPTYGRRGERLVSPDGLVLHQVRGLQIHRTLDLIAEAI